MVLSELPVMMRCSQDGLNATARISRSWAWILVCGAVEERVSQLDGGVGEWG